MDYYWWFILAAFLFVLEILTPGFVILWFGVGAVAAGLLELAGFESLALEIIVFVVVSLTMVSLSRTIFKNFFMKKSPGDLIKTNADVLIDANGVVTTEINNDLSSGRVLINGQDWSARSYDGSQIATETIVKVIRLEGVKLIVKPNN